VSLAQLVRFLVVELIYPVSNSRFNMVLHLRLIILSVGGDVPVDSDTLLVTEFVNLKIKSIQSFKDTHKNMMCVCVYRDE
jgi:hypothetical protein